MRGMFWAALIAVLFTTGCAGDSLILIDQMDEAFQRVAERHHAYVAADQTLSEAAKAEAYRDEQVIAVVGTLLSAVKVGQ